MDMIFDTATGDLAIYQTGLTPWGAPLRAVLKRHGQVINQTGLPGCGNSSDASGMRVLSRRLMVAQEISISLPDDGIFHGADCKAACCSG